MKRPMRPKITARDRANMSLLYAPNETYTGAPTVIFDKLEAAEAVLARPQRKKRTNPEADFQKTVAVYLKRALPPEVPWTAFPAGGGGFIRGAVLKGMGLDPGWADVQLLGPGGRYYGLELKAKHGYLSDEQKRIQSSIRAIGGEYERAKTLEQVEAWLLEWGFRLKGRL